MPKPIRIIGAGLAGSEAAWQCARRGVAVELFEMRPVRSTPAHQTANFAELVCSNSLKSDSENTAPWLLKEEMRRAGSLADGDRALRPPFLPGTRWPWIAKNFAEAVTAAIEREPLIEVVPRRSHRDRREQRDHDRRHRPADFRRAIARNPPPQRQRATLFLRFDQPHRRSRFHRHVAGVPGGALRQGHRRLHQLPHDQRGVRPLSRRADGSAFGRRQRIGRTLNYFESCLPIEEIARRGRDTLRFGPMKPVGLRDPRTGQMPYAVVQLRQENLRADSYNVVGFQNHLKFGEQARILRLIPGLENAKFLRYGQIHRNTYINGPTLLSETLQMKQHPNVLFAGQISGVEGYVESIATGLLAGMQASPWR